MFGHELDDQDIAEWEKKPCEKGKTSTLSRGKEMPKYHLGQILRIKGE